MCPVIGGSLADACTFDNGLRIAAVSLLESCCCFLFRTWTLINIRPCLSLETCHIGHGRRRLLIDFGILRWRIDKMGETPCRGSREQNARSGKAPADHFFALRPDQAADGFGTHAKASFFEIFCCRWAGTNEIENGSLILRHPNESTLLLNAQVAFCQRDESREFSHATNRKINLIEIQRANQNFLRGENDQPGLVDPHSVRKKVLRW